MWRKTLIITAVLFGIVAGVLLGLTSERVADNLRQRAILWAREQYGLGVQIERIELTLLPLQITASDVRVRRPDETTDWIRLDSGTLQVHPWPSPGGALIIDALELDGLYFDARQLSDTEGDGGDEESWSLPRFDIRKLAIAGSRIIVPTPDGMADIDDLNFEMRPEKRGVRVLDAHFARGQIAHQDETFEIQASVQARLRGTVDRPRSLELTSGQIKLPRLTLSTKGRADFEEGLPRFDFRVGAELDLSELSRFFDKIPALKGQASPTLVLKGTATKPEIRVEFEASDVQLADAEFGEVSLDAVYDERQILIEAFEVEHPRGGRITGSATVGLGEDHFLQANARLHNVRLEDVLTESGLPDSWIRMLLNSDARATGTLSPLDLNVELDGIANRFEVLGNSYRNSDARRFLELKDVPLYGRANVSIEEVRLSGFSLGPGAANFIVDGSIHYDRGLDLRARSDKTDLSWFETIADVPFTGQGPVAAAIEGPFKELVVSGAVEMASFGLLDYRLGETNATLIYSDSTLRLERVTVKRGQGELSGGGQLVFDDGIAELDLAAEMDRVAFGPAMRDLKLPQYLSERVRGHGSGRLFLNGDVTSLTGLVHVKSRDATFDRQEFGDLSLHVGFGNGSESVWCELGLTEESQLIDGRIAFMDDETIKVRGEFEGVPLRSIRRFIGGAAVDGTGKGRFELAGPIDRLEGLAKFQIEDFVALGARFETTKARVNFAGGEATVTGTLLSGDLPANGTIRLTDTLPFNLSGSFKELESTRMMALGPSIQSKVTGSLFSQGALFEPTKVTADFRVERWVLVVADQKLVSTKTINLGWTEQTLLIPEATFDGPEVRFGSAGRIPLEGSMNVTVVGEGTLAAAAALSRRVRRGTGPMRFSLEIGGSIAEPTLDGDFTIENGELALAGARRPATDINARVTFNGAAANVDFARMRFGGGDVRIGGQVVLGGQAGAEASLRADFDRVALEPAEDIDASISGSLNLLGPLGELRLRGSVNIDRLNYRRNVSLASIIPRRGTRSPLNVPAIESSEAIALAVKIHADETISFTNNVLDAIMKADLTLTGTTNRMGLLGTVTPVSAKARYAGNVFELERGTIDFMEEYEIFSRFSLRARAEACDMDVIVDVYGDSEAYNVSPSGSDENGPVDPQEVLICLQFGARQRDFTSGGTPETSSAVGGVGDELAAAVSGIDALWTVSGLDDRVREVLPIDEVRITNAWSPQANAIRPRLVLGKDIGEAVRLQYWQSILDDKPEEAYQALSIQYRLSRRATLEGTWLSEYQAIVPVTDLGLDLRLRWELR